MAKNKRNQGSGNFGNPEQHARAGKMGGDATSKTHDRSFYEEIGSQSSGKFKAGDQRTKDAAQKGGQTVSQDREHMSDIGREGGRSSGNQNDNQAA